VQTSIFAGIFIMAFLGSWHCGVMCGPLSCNFRKRENFFSYHLGRLISYSMISILLFFGTHYFLDTDSRGLKLAASLFFGILLIVFGFAQLQMIPGQKRASFRFFKIHVKILETYRTQLNQFPILLGLLTGFFPCGWLYSFLVMSSQMKSLSQALLVIFIFWLTSLPAFLVFTGFMNHLISSAPLSYQKISAAVLITAGLFSILGHWVHLIVM
jgi:uncharacterized protein